MGLTREKLKERAIKTLDEYIKTHGYKLDNYIVWETYPICVKDICVFSAVIDLTDNTTKFCDFEKDPKPHIDKSKAIRTYDDLDHQMITALYNDLVQYDKEAVLKASKSKKKSS